MTFYDKAVEAVKIGVPLLKISELPVQSEIVRIKSVVPNDKLDDLTVIANHLEDQMAELVRMENMVELILAGTIKEGKGQKKQNLTELIFRQLQVIQ